MLTMTDPLMPLIVISRYYVSHDVSTYTNVDSKAIANIQINSNINALTNTNTDIHARIPTTNTLITDKSNMKDASRQTKTIIGTYKSLSVN